MPLLLQTRSVINVAQNIYNSSVASNMFKYLGPSFYLTQSRSYAARKGTRERRKKQKVKIEETKIKFVPHNQRDELKYVQFYPLFD